MNYIDIMKNRVSRRSFSDLLVTKNQQEIINESISKIDEKGIFIKVFYDNKTAFEKMRKTYGMFKNVNNFFLVYGDKSIDDFYEKIGYYAEQVLLDIESTGLKTCWAGASFDDNNKLYGIDSNYEIVAAIAFGNSQEKTIKEKVIQSFVKINKRLENVETYIDKDSKDFDIEKISTPIKMIAIAPSAINKHPIRVNIVKDRVKIYPLNDKKYSLIDLGIAKKHFELSCNCELLSDNTYKIN